MRIEWDVPITMDDGLVLRADVYRPDDDGRYPVILTYGPYAKDLAFQDGYPSAWQRMVAEHPDVAAARPTSTRAGRWSTRRSGCPRAMSACASIRAAPAARRASSTTSRRARRKDFYHCIEWAGVQPWSNGKVGLNGISYYGMNQWHVASLQPPHLAAMCVWEGAADWYRDMTHHGGILSTFWANWYDMQVKTVQYGLGERGPRSRVNGEPGVRRRDAVRRASSQTNRCDFGDEILAHPLDDEYHRAARRSGTRSPCRSFRRRTGAGRACTRAATSRASCEAASKDKWLEAHGLEHWTHFYTDYGRELQLRFFDYFLKGEARLDRASRRCSCRCATRQASSSGTRTSGRSRARNGRKLYLTGLVALRTPAREATVTFDALGEGLTFSPSARTGDRDHRARRGEAVVVVEPRTPTCSWFFASSRPTCAR